MAPRPRLAAVALSLALTFACTTVRAPAAAIDLAVPLRPGVAEPQLELWVESSNELDANTLAQASDDARRALREAVAPRQAAGDGVLLVVRAQAVSRTADRRADQKAAVVGIVVGAVVIAAVVVLAIVSGKGGGAPGSLAVRGGHAVRRPVPVGVPAGRPRVMRVASPRPASPPVTVVAVGPIEPPPPPDALADPPYALADPPYALADPPDALAPGPPPLEPAEDVGTGSGRQGAPDALGATGAERLAPEVVTVTLPPPPPLELWERGYFAKDLLRLELLVLDPRDGTVQASKVVTREVDVREGKAVRALLASALDDSRGWTPAAWSVPAADPRPSPASAPTARAAGPPAAPGSP